MTDGPEEHVLAEHGTHQLGLLCPGNCRRREVLEVGAALCDDGESRVLSDGLDMGNGSEWRKGGAVRFGKWGTYSGTCDSHCHLPNSCSPPSSSSTTHNGCSPLDKVRRSYAYSPFRLSYAQIHSLFFSK